MKKSDVVSALFHGQIPTEPKQEMSEAFAPTNIALCKYWGKRDSELNLPVTSSLSVALPGKGAITQLSIQDQSQDRIILNDQEIGANTPFSKRLTEFLDLFRPQKNWYLQITIKMNIPVAAGLASSACGFASIVLALKTLFAWQLKQRDLSILARLGSGSACRSLSLGFVEWQAGVQEDGMDSYGEALPVEWPGLCLGILAISDQQKAISSREAMQRTVDTSVLYSAWPKKMAQDMAIVKQALRVRNLSLLAGTAESNALSMHATILSSWPPICYFLPETIAAMHKIWNLRRDGLLLYFTQDAGPNLKLLFLETDQDEIRKHFPPVEVIRLF